MKYPKLYKQTATGAIQEWQIFFSNGEYYTVSGQVGGKKITSSITKCFGKNLGKANETTPDEQARVESAAKWTKQVDRGYVQDITKVGMAELRVDPMLAKKYEDYSDHSFPIASQPKFDGLRCIITRQGAFSRLWKPFPTLDYIREELDPIFKAYPEIIAFDGEAYSHELKHDFEQIVSIIKKKNITKTDYDRCMKWVKYHTYDIVMKDPEPFSKRANVLETVLNQYVVRYTKLVSTAIVSTIEQLNDWYATYIKLGYEGQMVRNLSSVYQHKRTKDLLKRKTFLDDEFRIIGVKEGKGGREGCVILRLETQSKESFDSVPIGPINYLRKLWDNRDKLIGLYATVKYQNLTTAGVPRFNNTIKIRNENLEEIAF